MDAKQLKDGDFFEVTGSVFKNIKESWEAVKLNLATFAILLVIPAVLALGVLTLAFLPAITGTDAGTATAVFVALVGFLAVLVIALMIAPAIVLTQLASVVGKKIEPGDAFNAGKKYVVRYIVLGLLSIILIVIGLVLFIIPGILAMFFLSLSPYILIDKDLSATEAMKASYKLTQEYWKPVIAVVLVQFVISIVGYVPFIGWIISLALSVATFCLAPYIYSVITSKKVIKA